MQKFQRSRKYPDYLTCGLPDFIVANPSLPVESENVGRPFPGCLPYGPVLAGESTDPDNSKPLSTLAYVHPSLPGLLLKCVRNREELFRSGSSYITISNGQLATASGYFGADAEAAVLGEVVALQPADGATGMVHRKRARSAEEKTALKAAMDVATIPSDLVQNTTLVEMTAVVPKLFNGLRPSNAIAAGAVDLGSVVGRLDTVVPASGGMYVMAVLCSSERGWFSWAGHAHTGGIYCHGAMYDYIDVVTVESLVNRYTPEWLSGMDSDIRKYAVKGIRDEMASRRVKFPAGEMIRAPIGVTAVGRSVNMPGSAGELSKLWSPGFLVPVQAVGHVNSAAFLSMPGPNYVGGVFCTVGSAPIKGHDQRQSCALAQRHLWAYANLDAKSNSLKPRLMNFVNQSEIPEMNIADWLKHSARYASLLDSAAIRKAADDNGTPTVVNGANTIVPSVLGKTQWGIPLLQTIMHSEFAGLPTKLVADVFRRAYGRAEAYARRG